MASLRVSLLRLCLLVAGLGWVPALGAASLGERHPVDPRLGRVFQLARQIAIARLSDSACQAVLSDFDDARTGRPAAETLAATGLSMPAFFASLRFLAADGHGYCRKGTSLARTPVGAPVVFVCSSRLLALARGNPDELPVVLIHESLHALGVGEDPPTSEELTRRVRQRCGR